MMLNWETSTGKVAMPSAYDELSRIKRWVCLRQESGELIPYAANNVDVPINPLIKKNWATQSHAIKSVMRQELDAVGLVLNGDGVVAIHLDDCVDGISIRSGALEFMLEIGCGLVEVDVRGSGILGLGYAPHLKSTDDATFKGMPLTIRTDRTCIPISGEVVIGAGLRELGTQKMLQTMLRYKH